MWTQAYRVVISPPPAPPHMAQSSSGTSLLIIEDSRLHSDTPDLVGLPWTNDQPEVGTST